MRSASFCCCSSTISFPCSSSRMRSVSFPVVSFVSTSNKRTLSVSFISFSARIFSFSCASSSSSCRRRSCSCARSLSRSAFTSTSLSPILVVAISLLLLLLPSAFDLVSAATPCLASSAAFSSLLSYSVDSVCSNASIVDSPVCTELGNSSCPVSSSSSRSLSASFASRFSSLSTLPLSSLLEVGSLLVRKLT